MRLRLVAGEALEIVEARDALPMATQTNTLGLHHTNTNMTNGD